MLFNSIVVATLLSLGSAIPLASPQTGLPEDGVYRWKVQGWLTKCAPGSISDCTYRKKNPLPLKQTKCQSKLITRNSEFKIEGDDFGAKGIPSFKETCEGKFFDGSVSDGSFQSTCSAPFLKARITDGDDMNLLLAVSYEFRESRIGGSLRTFTSAGTKARKITRTNPQSFNIDNIEERSEFAV
ncbi:hypothetical protein HYALB_00013856 [Hymenoscyphus albidus]|uniref:Cyanovirin-N domain-containing protein n=1 Tax=Hymenoscyphus albidus TaxID=595503 RepID=A0A9N9LZ67_9HELO|nr:hypothetical protein HYALB_00013409 [Hymenoscyphus albidus]CAG8981196.1 hypothetical protein HYALB_00013856 [Hymenoscyphus albidus]